MRVVHATDLHWFVPPPLCRIQGKRVLGTANLYLTGRRHHFDPAVQAAAVDAMVALAPDAAVISGDLTAQALPEEFAKAREVLDPLLTAVPTFVQPGNHDVYTRGAARDDRLGATFGPFLHRGAGGVARWRLPGLSVIGLDPNRPHLTASGLVPDAQLAALPGALADVPAGDVCLLSLHYPVLDRHGAVYDHWEHGLRNAHALVAALRASPRRPDLIVHGHVHHGYRATLDLGDAQVPTFNPGSGGYAWMPEKHRAACFNLYELAPGAPPQVTRYRYDGQRFAPEDGGAYASGR